MFPNAYLRPMQQLQQLNEFSSLDLLAKQVVEGFIIGLHKSPFHGFSVEFAEHRLYNQGEPTKNIDWKVYGRTDKMFVKRYEEETNLRCQIVIDASSSMLFPKDDKTKPSKLKFSVVAAASIINLLKRQRDAYGLSVFTDSVKINSNARATMQHQQMLFSQLEELLKTQALNVKTNATKCLHEIAETVHKRSMIVLFSDMFDGKNTEELFAALQHLKYNKHEVILFHVTDKQQELDFTFENRPYEFVDMESGEKLKLQPNDVKEFYTTQMDKFYTKLKLKCAQYNIEFVAADINKDYREVLLPFLLKRTKMM